MCIRDRNTLVGDELHVNIEQEGGRLFFRLWKYHKWGSFTLYYLSLIHIYFGCSFLSHVH